MIGYSMQGSFVRLVIITIRKTRRRLYLFDRRISWCLEGWKTRRPSGGVMVTETDTFLSQGLRGRGRTGVARLRQHTHLPVIVKIASDQKQLGVESGLAASSVIDVATAHSHWRSLMWHQSKTWYICLPTPELARGGNQRARMDGLEADQQRQSQ